MTTKLPNLAQIKRSLRKGGIARHTLAGAALGGGVTSLAAYTRAKVAQKDGAPDLDPGKLALLHGIEGGLVGAATASPYHYGMRIVKTINRKSAAKFYKQAASAGAIGAGVGAAALGTLGAIRGATSTPKYDLNTGEYSTQKGSLWRSVKGAVGGAMLGAYVGSTVAEGRKQTKLLYKTMRQNPGGFPVRATRGHREILKDFEAPQGFKTKAEAKTHYRKKMSQYHPDRSPGVNPATSQKINKAWDDLQKTEYFEKLAHLFLLKRKGQGRA